MKNFRGSALAAGVGTPESAPHELLGSSLIFICVSNIGTVLKNIPCVSECVTSSITVPQSSRMTHHLSLNDNPVIIYGHLAILHGPPRHPARPTSPSCTTRHVIMNLFQNLFFASLDSGSSPDDCDKQTQITGQTRMTEEG